jgi:hypothetical protein
MRIYRTATLS